VLAALTAILAVLVLSVAARAGTGDRTLNLYYTHTGETGSFTFRKNGKYDPKVLDDLNWFLRDWRRNEEIKMDPHLFDLVWEVYQESGATQPIHIVSAYRAPATNEMLRSKSSAVAKNSRHTHGMAMDFFIPGIPISKLRALAMKLQVGGVGYYPTSGSPFVHLDTGSVRAWPRMTRAQLEKLFPKGQTMHVPADGNPLSQSGYQYAKTEWTKCHEVPCSNPTLRPTIRVASNSSNTNSPGSGGTVMSWLFGNGQADDADKGSVPDPVRLAAATASASDVVPIPAPLPTDLYPGSTGGQSIAVAALDNAPQPLSRPGWLKEDPATTAGIGRNAPLSASRGLDGATTSLVAYAPVPAPEPDAQRALQMLIERQSGTTSAPRPLTNGLRLASVDSGSDGGLSALIANSLKAVDDQPIALTAALAGTARLKARQSTFQAPDLEHILEIFVDPAAMASARYAVIFEHDTPDIDPQTDLGSLIGATSLQSDPAFGLNMAHFTNRRALVVALR